MITAVMHRTSVLSCNIEINLDMDPGTHNTSEERKILWSEYR